MNDSNKLTVFNVKGTKFYDVSVYPLYHFTKGNSTTLMLVDRHTNIPEGYARKLVYENQQDHFNQYVKQITEENKGISDKVLMNMSFLGRNSTNRLLDEIRRRGLNKMTLEDYKQLRQVTPSQERRAESLKDLLFVEEVLEDLKSKIELDSYVDFKLDVKTINANLENIVTRLEDDIEE